MEVGTENVKVSGFGPAGECQAACPRSGVVKRPPFVATQGRGDFAGKSTSNRAGFY